MEMIENDYFENRIKLDGPNKKCQNLKDYLENGI